MSKTTKPRPIKVAICFFGITRALSITRTSIEESIMLPARELGEVRAFGHFFRQQAIDNPRSEENSTHNPDNYTQLNLDWACLDEPDTFIDQEWFSLIKSYGDEYNDDFRSLRNLIHQLYSLKRVSAQALSWRPDLYIFARPDLIYHDKFDRIVERAVATSRNTVFLPNWAHWGPGYNDRFCVCAGERAARAYAERMLYVNNFCADEGKLHAEKLVKYSLDRSDVNVKYFSVRASRARSNGKIVNENFEDFRWVLFKQRLKLPQRLARRALNLF